MHITKTIDQGIFEFRQRWGVLPYAMIMHPMTFGALIAEKPPAPDAFLEYANIKILRSPDMPLNQIRFVL